MEKIRWFVYEIEPVNHPGLLQRLKPCSDAEKPKEALSSVYKDPTEVYEGHDLISGSPYYVLVAWNVMFVVCVSRIKVAGEKRIFECWA